MSASQRVSRSRPVRPAQTVTEGVQVVSVQGSAFGVEREQRTVLEVEPFVTEPAYIRVSAGTTKNLGNYESFRVDVSITMPCYPEEIEEVRARVSDTVASLLEDELMQYGINNEATGG